MNEPTVSRLAELLGTLKPKSKTPVSATVLTNWITKAANDLGPHAGGGRLAWLVASSVAVAAVQRAIDADGNRLFLLKGLSRIRDKPFYLLLSRLLSYPEWSPLWVRARWRARDNSAESEDCVFVVPDGLFSFAGVLECVDFR
jgi:hypothetical protein